MRIFIYDDDDLQDAYEFAIDSAFPQKDHTIIYANTFSEFLIAKEYEYDIALIDWQLDFHEDRYLNALDVIKYINANKIAIVTGLPDVKGNIDFYPVYIKPFMAYHFKALVESKKKTCKLIVPE